MFAKQRPRFTNLRREITVELLYLRTDTTIIFNNKSSGYSVDLFLRVLLIKCMNLGMFYVVFKKF